MRGVHMWSWRLIFEDDTKGVLWSTGTRGAFGEESGNVFGVGSASGVRESDPWVSNTTLAEHASPIRERFDPREL